MKGVGKGLDTGCKGVGRGSGQRLDKGLDDGTRVQAMSFLSLKERRAKTNTPAKRDYHLEKF